MVIAAYKPQARCDGFPGPSPESCRTLLNTMSASERREVFGGASFPNVDVKLPVQLSSGKTKKSHCKTCILS